MGAKKAVNLFQTYCSLCRCGAADYFIFTTGIYLDKLGFINLNAV